MVELRTQNPVASPANMGKAKKKSGAKHRSGLGDGQVGAPENRGIEAQNGNLDNSTQSRNGRKSTKEALTSSRGSSSSLVDCGSSLQSVNTWDSEKGSESSTGSSYLLNDRIAHDLALTLGLVAEVCTIDGAYVEGLIQTFGLAGEVILRNAVIRAQAADLRSAETAEYVCLRKDDIVNFCVKNAYAPIGYVPVPEPAFRDVPEEQSVSDSAGNPMLDLDGKVSEVGRESKPHFGSVSAAELEVNRPNPKTKKRSPKKKNAPVVGMQPLIGQDLPKAPDVRVPTESSTKPSNVSVIETAEPVVQRLSDVRPTITTSTWNSQPAVESPFQPWQKRSPPQRQYSRPEISQPASSPPGPSHYNRGGGRGGNRGPARDRREDFGRPVGNQTNRTGPKGSPQLSPRKTEMQGGQQRVVPQITKTGDNVEKSVRVRESESSSIESPVKAQSGNPWASWNVWHRRASDRQEGQAGEVDARMGIQRPRHLRLESCSSRFQLNPNANEFVPKLDGSDDRLDGNSHAHRRAEPVVAAEDEVSVDHSHNLAVLMGIREPSEIHVGTLERQQLTSPVSSPPLPFGNLMRPPQDGDEKRPQFPVGMPVTVAMPPVSLMAQSPSSPIVVQAFVPTGDGQGFYIPVTLPPLEDYYASWMFHQYQQAQALQFSQMMSRGPDVASPGPQLMFPPHFSPPPQVPVVSEADGIAKSGEEAVVPRVPEADRNNQFHLNRSDAEPLQSRHFSSIWHHHHKENMESYDNVAGFSSTKAGSIDSGASVESIEDPSRLATVGDGEIGQELVEAQ